MTRKVTRGSDQQPKTQSKSHDEKGKGPMMTVNAGIIVVAITPPMHKNVAGLASGLTCLHLLGRTVLRRVWVCV